MGWIKLENFHKSENKLDCAYLLTPMGLVEKDAFTARFLKRKKKGYNKLQAEIAFLQKQAKKQKVSDKQRFLNGKV